MIMNTTASSSESVWDVVVVGAGPSGLFTGITVLKNDGSLQGSVSPLRVLILDHAKLPGLKLLTTGNGQCNLTNALPMKEFVTRYGSGGKQIRRVLYDFNNVALREYFQQRGVATVETEDLKVFPESMKSRDVLDALVSDFTSLGGELRLSTDVISVEARAEGGFDVETSTGSVPCNNLVIACGGITYPKTGSDGSIWRVLKPLLKKQGLSRTELAPALTPLFPKNYPFGELRGLSFSNVAISSVSETGAQTELGRGDILFTDRGFSGPLALDCSKHLTPGQRFAINFDPSRSRDMLADELFKTLSSSKKALAAEVHYFFDFPRRFVDLLVSGHYGNGGITLNPPYHTAEISKKQVRLIVDFITSSVFTLEKLGGAEQAMVTKGGFPLDELDLNSMQVKSIPNLHFVGEVVDVDGDTGGFNLQWAFSSASACGSSLVAQNN